MESDLAMFEIQDSAFPSIHESDEFKIIGLNCQNISEVTKMYPEIQSQLKGVNN